ncbi:MAG: SDR family oxidoreductase [Acidobacteriota bacterium]|nr:SDR family oxidoreductase [Acidobacteriota bacterium]
MILVTGATGKVGSALIKELEALKAPYRAGVRHAGSMGMDSVAFDFDDPETFGAALTGVERLFLLTSGVTEREGPAVDAAKAAGVRHIVKLSAWGSEKEDFAFGRHHRAIEKRIEASGVPWTFLRPNGFMQNYLTQAATIKGQGAFYLPSGGSKYSLIDARDVGAVAARVLTATGHEGRAYALSGPESLSNGEIARKLSAATGKPVNYVDVPDDVFRKSVVESGVPGPYADDYIDLLHYYRAGKATAVTADVESVTGKPPRTFDEFAGDFAAQFKSEELP